MHEPGDQQAVLLVGVVVCVVVAGIAVVPTSGSAAVETSNPAVSGGNLQISSQSTFDFESGTSDLGQLQVYSRTLAAADSTAELNFTNWRHDNFDSTDYGGILRDDSAGSSDIRDPNGDSFRFVSFTTEAFCGASRSFDVVGYEDGQAVGTKSYSISSDGGPTTRSVGFTSVDEVRFENYQTTNDGGCLTIDDIIVTSAGSGNAAPQFSNLDAGITFDEESATPVVLDSDATVSDTELDTAADYAGSTLTVAREGGANSDDNFGFDTGAGTFAVSGSDLTTNGNTFGSFSQSGGTLSIDFDSDQATATSALVDDVLQSVTYETTGRPDAFEYGVSFTFDDGDSGGALSTSGTVAVTYDPALDQITAPTTFGFDSLDAELDNQDEVDQRIIQEVLFYGFKFVPSSASPNVDSDELQFQSGEGSADPSATNVRFEADEPFLLDAIDINNFDGDDAQDVTLYGYRDGTLVESVSYSLAADSGYETKDVDADKAGFKEVDEVRFTSSVSDLIAIDNIVLDITNQPPTFDNGASTSLTVDEDSSNNDVDSLLAVTDPDSGDTLEWSVASDPNSGSLGGFPDSVGAGSGVEPSGLTYTPNADFSGSDSFEVVVSDGTGSNTTTVDVTVRDAPEIDSITRASPTSQITNVSSVDFEVGFSENVGGVTMDDFTATQVSGDVSGSVAAVSGSDSSYTVTVDSIVGEGDLRLDVLDDDSITSDSTGIELGGGGTAGSSDGSFTGGESFTIDTTDPLLTADSGSTDEDTTATIVDDLLSNDNDATALSVTEVAGSAANVGVATAGGNGGLFTIMSDGQVDFDPNGTFDSLAVGESDTTQLTVTVADAAGNTNTQSVTATINGVNDAPATPGDSDGGANEVAEAATNGATVGVDADTTDPEGDTITWSLTDDAGGRFDIDGSGVVTLADTSQLDFETTASHDITVQASDGSLSTTEAFTISVTDSDETPVFTSGTDASVSESAAGGTVVQDVDANVGGSTDEGVSYAITDGNTDGAYAIDNTGQLTVDDASRVDNESAPSRTLTVEASEGTASDTQEITITVTDVDETPGFTSGTADTVAEDADNGDPVHDVDADVGGDSDEAVSYAITSGNDAGAFTIDSTGGVISVADASQFDHEGTNSFSLTIEASEGTATNTQTVTVSVTDVDETPVFAGVGAQTVAESATVGTAVVDIDADLNKTGDTPVDTGVSYAIIGGNADVAGNGGGAFAIDATGQLTVSDPDDVDRSAQSSFTLTINASEGSQNATQAVTITVVDDVTPTLSSSDPSDDSTGHVPSDDLTLTFDEPVDFGTGLITLRKNDGGFSDAETFDVTTDTGSGDGNVSISGNQLRINPTIDLEADTEYAVRIAATAITDTATTSNAYIGISNDDDLDFTTANTKPSFAQATGGTIGVSVIEDGSLDLTNVLEVNDISASDTLTWSVESPPDNGTVTGVDGESVTFSSDVSHALTSGPEYVPDADFAGAGSPDDTFDVRVTDGDAYTASATVEVDVEQVNDAPTVTLGSDRTVNGTTSQQTADGFASFVPGGGSDEAGQSVDDYTITITNDPEGVLSAVDIDTDGNLTYTANDSAEGTATVSVTVTDDGGTANGGTNTSSTESFEITVDTRAPTVEGASTTARTVTITMDEPLSEAASTTPPGENFTVTAGESRINVSTVAINGSMISLGLDSSVSFGEAVTLNYTRGTNITEDLATNQLANVSDQPVINTVSRPNRGRRGGGGGGSDSDDTEATVTVEPENEFEADDESSTDTDSETDGSAADDGIDSRSVAVRGVTGGERVRIDLSEPSTERSSEGESTGDSENPDGTESGNGGADDDDSNTDGDDTDPAPEQPRNVVADGLDIQFVESGDYDLTVRTRDADTSDNAESATGSGNADSNADGDSGSTSRPDLSTNSLDDEGQRFARETRQRPVGFIEVDTAFEEDAVEEATHRFRVRKSYLESTGASVESVRLYRDEISQWRELDTRQVGANEEFYFFEADTPGFSVFVIGTSAPVFETASPTLESFNETTGEINATVSVENIGSTPGVYESTLTAGGTSLSTVEREIGAGETVEILVSGVVESTEPVTVGFAGQSIGEVTRSEPVDEKSATTSVWLLAVIAGILVALAVVWRRRTSNDD